jgi:glycosyltransferase involved in cell wall biosynthesis
VQLLVLNYSMNPHSTIFSHQRAIVGQLKSKFESVTVVTAESDIGHSVEGVVIKSLDWIQGRALRNTFQLLRIVLPLIIKKRKNLIVFCHMTDAFAFVLAPVCKLLQIPIHLWYAHATKSVYLRFGYHFFSSIMTSTVGSCPIKGDKVEVIGQAIEIPEFALMGDEMPRLPPLRWYHVSRLDPSKNLEIIIGAILELRTLGYGLTLDIYGDPSSKKHLSYANTLKSLAAQDNYSSWLKFHGPVLRSNLRKIAASHDGFVHAFSGSLDKSVLEAIASKRLVVSTNSEYRNEFKVQEITLDSPVSQLVSEISAYLAMDESDINKEIEKQFDILNQRHSLEHWVCSVHNILCRDRS